MSYLKASVLETQQLGLSGEIFGLISGSPSLDSWPGHKQADISVAFRCSSRQT